MAAYVIQEKETSGFGTEWNITAKSLTSAKRQASRLQKYINTTLRVYEIYNGRCVPVAEKGPLEREGSKWSDIKYD